MKKRGAMTLSDLAPIAIAFVFVAVVIGVGATVLSSIAAGQITGAANCNSSSQTKCGYDYNATNQGLNSVDELSSWLPTIALVVAAAVVIGVLSFFKA